MRSVRETQQLLQQAAPSTELDQASLRLSARQSEYISALLQDRRRSLLQALGDLERAGWFPRHLFAAHDAFEADAAALERPAPQQIQALLHAEALRGVASRWQIPAATWGRLCRGLGACGPYLNLVVRELRIQGRDGWLWRELVARHQPRQGAPRLAADRLRLVV